MPPLLTAEAKVALEQALSAAVGPALTLPAAGRLGFVASHLLARLSGGEPPAAPPEPAAEAPSSSPAEERGAALEGLKRAITLALNEAARQKGSDESPLKRVADALIRMEAQGAASSSDGKAPNPRRGSFSGEMPGLSIAAPAPASAAAEYTEAAAEQTEADRNIRKRIHGSITLEGGLRRRRSSASGQAAAMASAVAASGVQVAAGAGVALADDGSFRTAVDPLADAKDASVVEQLSMEQPSDVQLDPPPNGSSAAAAAAPPASEGGKGLRFAAVDTIVPGSPEKNWSLPSSPEKAPMSPDQARRAAEQAAERQARYEVYTCPTSIFDAVRTREVVLLRATWVLARAGFRYDESKGWVLRGEPEPLPTRGEIEETASLMGAALMRVEELEEGYAAFQAVISNASGTNAISQGDELPGGGDIEAATTTALEDGVGAVPVVVTSYCWEKSTNPDPSGKTLTLIATRLARELPKYQSWGFADVGVYYDWSSLYQEPRDDRQAECFERALANTSIWYAHDLTTVYHVTDPAESGGSFATSEAAAAKSARRRSSVGALGGRGLAEPPAADDSSSFKAARRRGTLTLGGGAKSPGRASAPSAAPAAEDPSGSNSARRGSAGSAGSVEEERLADQRSARRGSMKVSLNKKGAGGGLGLDEGGAPLGNDTGRRGSIGHRTSAAMHAVTRRVERGWPFFEESMSYGLKKAFRQPPTGKAYTLAGQREQKHFWRKVIDLGEGSVVEDHFLKHFPPLAPSRFASELKGKRFLDSDDRAILTALYEEAMEDGLGGLTSLKYRQHGWGDEEVADLAATVAEVRAQRLELLDLGGNDELGNEGMQGLGAAIGKGAFRTLEKLDLSFCGRFAELPVEIGKCVRLVHVNLSHCRKLRELPPSIGSLKQLQMLNLRFCSHLAKLPDECGKLCVLHSLILSQCQGLIEVPAAIAQCPLLTHMPLDGCDELISLPDLSAMEGLDVGTLPQRLKNWDTNGRVAFDFRRTGRRRAVSMDIRI